MSRVIDLLGVAVFAISGALAGDRKGLDPFGLFVVAAVTSIGGGTLRDLMLNRRPFWINDSDYLIVIACAVLATMLWGPSIRSRSTSLLIADAFGLAFFTISGAQIARQTSVSPLPAILLGTMTGAAGGAVRDILTAEIPLILRKEIYATAAIVGCAICVLMGKLGFDSKLATVTGILSIFSLRVAAIRWDLHLPRRLR